MDEQDVLLLVELLDREEKRLGVLAEMYARARLMVRPEIFPVEMWAQKMEEGRVAWGRREHVRQVRARLCPCPTPLEGARISGETGFGGPEPVAR